jgi:hypothetical protein
MTMPELRRRARITLDKLQCLETGRRECRCGFSLGYRSGNGAGSCGTKVLGGSAGSYPPPLLLSRFDGGASRISVVASGHRARELLREPRDRVFNLRRIDERFGRNPPRLAGKSQRGSE